MKSYDAIVIGAGQGGPPMGHKLADKGQKIAIIEREFLGGSCINYGCTPTKTMISSARVAHYARRAADFGVHTGDVRVDLEEVVARKNKMVMDWRGGQQSQIDKRSTIDLYRGQGRFTGPHEVEVNGENLSSQRIFIDTGTRPRIPPLPGLDTVEYLTNRNIMDLTTLPERLLILGGSYMGLEFGQMYRRFGADVTIIELNDDIVPHEDPEVSQTLHKILEEEGIEIHTGCKAERVGRTASGGIEVEVEHKDGTKQTLSGSHLFVGIGQVPNSDDMGLDKAGIEVDQGGWIKHNGKLETTAPGVWVIGDVKGGPAFTHVAYDDHLVIWDNIIEGKDRSIDKRVLPYALYTDPELGRVGMSETQARKAGHKLKVGSIPMEYVARAIERSETKGMMKVVIDAETDRILGATVLGPEGGDVVQTLMTLMLADAPWTLFYRAMFTHPTITEGFFSLMESVKDA